MLNIFTDVYIQMLKLFIKRRLTTKRYITLLLVNFSVIFE